MHARSGPICALECTNCPYWSYLQQLLCNNNYSTIINNSTLKKNFVQNLYNICLFVHFKANWVELEMRYDPLCDIKQLENTKYFLFEVACLPFSCANVHYIRHTYRDLAIVYTNENWFVISLVVYISGTKLLKYVTLVC